MGTRMQQQVKGPTAKMYYLLEILTDMRLDVNMPDYH